MGAAHRAPAVGCVLAEGLQLPPAPPRGDRLQRVDFRLLLPAGRRPGVRHVVDAPEHLCGRGGMDPGRVQEPQADMAHTHARQGGGGGRAEAPRRGQGGRLGRGRRARRQPGRADRHLGDEWAGLALGITAFALLTVSATLYSDAWHIVSFTVFGLTLLLLYGIYTLYHSRRSEP